MALIYASRTWQPGDRFADWLGEEFTVVAGAGTPFAVDDLGDLVCIDPNEWVLPVQAPEAGAT